MKIKTKQKSEKSVTIGDVLSVGVLIYTAYLLFSGKMLLTNDLQQSVLYAGVAVLAIILCLVLLVRCKKATNNRNAWFIAEMMVLVAFIAGCIWGFFPQRHVDYVQNNTNLLQRYIAEDVQEIRDNLFNEYETKEANDIATIGAAMRVTIPTNRVLYASNDNTRRRLESMEGDAALKEGSHYSRAQIDTISIAYERSLQGLLLGNAYQNAKASILKRLQDIEDGINGSASTHEYRSLTEELATVHSEAVSKLNEFSEMPGKQKISGSYDGAVTAEQMPNTYAPRYLNSEHFFSNEPKTTEASWLITIALIVGLLLTYFAAPRKRRLTVHTRARSGFNAGYDIV